MRRVVVAVPVVLALGCARVQGPRAWASEAEAFVEADIRLILAGPEESAALPLLREKAKVAEDLAQRPEPGRQRIVAGLASSSAVERRAALVFAITRRLLDQDVLRSVLRHYSPMDQFFSRYYAVQYLTMLEPSHIRALSRDVARLLMSEPDEGIRIVGASLVPWLEGEDALHVLRLYMKTGSPAVQRVGWAAGQSLGADFDRGLRSELRQGDCVDAIRVMELMDSGGGRGTLERRSDCEAPEAPPESSCEAPEAPRPRGPEAPPESS